MKNIGMSTTSSRRKNIVDNVKGFFKKPRNIVAGLGLLGTLTAGGYLLTRIGDNTNIQEEFAADYEFNRQTEGEGQAGLKRGVINGQELYVRKTEDGEIQFLPFESTTRFLDGSGRLLRIESELEYTLRRTTASNNYTVDSWADQVTLSPTYSQETGVGGVRARILNRDELRANATSLENDQNFAGEDIARFNIPTITLFGVEYYHPNVESNRTGDGTALDFYLIPKEGIEYGIDNSNGRITLINENNILRPMLTRKNTSYDISPGQAIGVTGN